ncbi:MAG: efflux RND transporter periplasmic adaptor subunit [Desulfarculus sp.]|jgi:HlyD family secretion protein|nr:MAG: efflux RND transporter periplasmic adaptor subunit [Desulfarculus sp.]
MKKIVIYVTVAAIAAAGGLFLYRLLTRPAESAYKTVRVQRGNIISTVSATGNLSAVITVQVGTQVSGTIQKLYVDYNSVVKEGQPIAQIDPSIFQAQVDQARGNYLAAVANQEKAKVIVADALRTLERYRKLVKDNLVAQSEFDTAQTSYDAALAALKATEAVVAQTKGAQDQAQTNLAYSTIKSPVDGIVVSRNVDVGQTVAASFQTPTLFTIAQDLTKMQIDTSVDEADIGKVKEGQNAVFSVDAFPERRFRGQVVQVRNAPVITQNVVTYVVVIGVNNKELLLRPGMTANVNLEVGRKNNVLIIPKAALRFRPKAAGAPAAKPGASPTTPAGRRSSKDMKLVYIVGPDNKPVAVPVKTGLADDSNIEINGGKLPEGSEVIIGQWQTKKKANSVSRPGMGMRF